MVRQKIEFDSLRAPFSVGYGQFVLQDARIDGPMMRATMSGRVDFRTRKVHVVGTFTPLAALNRILSDVPLLGDIMTGPKREGMFAWNYALQGGLENPQIVVNPVSGVAPGFTREFFRTEPAASLVAGEMLPDPALETDADLLGYIRAVLGTAMHPAGTCAMGEVLDAELRVRGIEGLRVADCSAMPTIVGGNTNAPAIMIAEKAADLVLGRSLPREEG